jgi:N-acetylglutamate synthase-like GNAT family acetyltransferase
MSVTIRKAQESDCPAVIELFKEMLDFHCQRDLHFTRAQLADEVFIDAFTNRIKEESSILMIAEKDGQVIGYAHGVLGCIP